MKKFLITLISFFLFSFAYAGDKFDGRGELSLHNVDVKYFMEYLSPPAGQSPSMYFIIAEDDKAIWSSYWYCPTGRCKMTNKSEATKKCVRDAEKYYKDKKYLECFVFAKKRVVTWDNDINPGTSKDSTFKSKWTKSRVLKKFSELGFNTH